MPKLTGTFSADGQTSTELLVAPQQDYLVQLTTAALTGSVELQQRVSPQAWVTLQTYTAQTAATEYTNLGTENVVLRLVCRDLDAGGGETVDYVLQSLLSGHRHMSDTRAKVGATAGWTVNPANNLGVMATLEAGQTGSTLVFRIDNLKIGAVIKGFYAVGQVESGGNTATLTVNLRKLTAAAADLVDASVATTGAISFTADAKLGRDNVYVENINATVADGESYYFLVTGTTGVSTDIALMGAVVEVKNGSE